MSLLENNVFLWKHIVRFNKRFLQLIESDIFDSRWLGICVFETVKIPLSIWLGIQARKHHQPLHQLKYQLKNGELTTEGELRLEKPISPSVIIDGYINVQPQTINVFI
jgi:hypothetical protein